MRIDEAIFGSPFLLRCFSRVNKITTTVVKEILNQIVYLTYLTDIEDVVRLLVIFFMMTIFVSSGVSGIAWSFPKHVETLEAMWSVSWAASVHSELIEKIQKWDSSSMFKILGCIIQLLEEKEALYPEHHQSEAESLRRENAELKRENEELRKLSKDLRGELGRLTRIVCEESLEDMFENHEHRDVDMVEGIENRDVDLVEEEGKRESELSEKELAEKEELSEKHEEECGELAEKEESELDGEEESS
ncbi:hypothetical protein IFM89_018195 [Coptis chinensis]|uniref:Uncharacterized protein n=1 Tax=Coptis chinensis TaxID=261450 RepID=A0A835I502_9MAGN|nr:hypothetical protein IFM89_018195 [Coptis chinensis]